MKKITAIILVVIMTMGVMLTGCGKASDNNGKKVKSDISDEKEKIELTFWRAGTNEQEGEYWKSVIKEFESKNPNVKIIEQGIPWGDEIETKLNVAYASGTGPDVLSYAIMSVAARAGLGQYAPIDEYLDKWDERDDYMESLLQLGEYKGKQYGIPFITDPRIFAWRKDIFEEVGLDPEQPPKNWEELEQFAQKCVVRDGDIVVRGGFDIPISNGFQLWQIHAMQSGASLMDIENNKPTFNSPEGIEAAKFLDSLVEQNLHIPSDQFKEGTNPFQSGKVAMGYVSPNMIKKMIADNPELEGKIGTSGPLTHKTKGTFCGARLLFISNDSKKKDIAWDFINTIMTAEQDWSRYQTIGASITFNSLKEKYIAEDPAINEAILDAVNVGTGAVKVSYSNAVNEAISLALEEMYYDMKTPEQALNDNAELLEKEIPTYLSK